MKKNQRACFFTFVCLFLLGNFEAKASWRQYVRLLNKTYPGFVPYKIPHASGNPGNVYHYESMEQLYCIKETCFPAIPTLPPDGVPAVFLNEISRVEFRVGAEVKDRNVLPQNISGVAGIAITSNTSAFIFPMNPQIIKIEEIRIEEKLRNLNMSVVQEELLLRKLCENNYFIVSGALRFDGFEFVFHRDSDLDASLAAQMNQGSTSANLTYRRLNSKDFSISANTPMFFAYYAYPSDTEEARRLLTDKLRMKQIQEQESLRQSTAARISSIESSRAELGNLKTRLQAKNAKAGEMQGRIENIQARIQKTKSSRSLAAFNDQLQATESELHAVRGEISSLNGLIKTSEAEQGKLHQYNNELDILNSTAPANMVELEELNKRSYKILKKEYFIPADIAEELKKK